GAAQLVILPLVAGQTFLGLLIILVVKSPARGSADGGLGGQRQQRNRRKAHGLPGGFRNGLRNHLHSDYSVWISRVLGSKQNNRFSGTGPSIPNDGFLGRNVTWFLTVFNPHFTIKQTL